jgi:Cft2 family RNA processing exonuclease
MFHYDRGLHFTALGLAVDVTRRQPRGFISHAHTDHMGRHELAYCTPATAELYQHRYGPRLTHAMPFGEPLRWGGFTLTTHPAGHVLGSAMLHVQGEHGSVLYTGDFKLGPSATAEPADPPRADVLIMETTYGDPRFRLPAREEAIGTLIDLVQQVLTAGRTPLVHAYVLGKAQEVSQILQAAGLHVVQHPQVYEITKVYRRCGCPLEGVSLCEGPVPRGAVAVVPPPWQRVAPLAGLKKAVHIGVTGWAMDSQHALARTFDHVVPLSDHADYAELMECIDRVAPTVIYCTHGPASFVAHLRHKGYNAFALEDCQHGVTLPHLSPKPASRG